MITSKWCNENLNASQITMNSIVGEMKEVIESKTLDEVKEEISDVLYFVYCYMESKVGINLPMLGAKKTVDKVISRSEVWKKIFAENGLEFDKKYLSNGSNYVKKEKVNKALESARMEQF